MNGQLSAKDNELKIAATNHQAADSNQKSGERQLSETSGALAACQAKSAVFQWHNVSRPGYIQLIERQRQANEEAASIGLQVQSLRAAEEKAESEFRALDLRKKQNADELERKRRRVAQVKSLEARHALWQENTKKLKETSDEITNLTQSLQLLRAQEIEILPKLAAEQTNRIDLSRQIADIERNQSELKVLLSQLESHVTDGFCPVCGDDHGTKEALLAKINSHVQADAARAARQALESIKQNIRNLEGELSQHKQKQISVQQQITVLQAQKGALENELEAYLNEVASLGTATNGKESVISEILSIILLSAEQDVQAADQQDRIATEALETARINLANASESLSRLIGEEGAKRATAARLTSELEQLKSDQRWKETPLDIPEEQLSADEDLNARQVEHLRTVFATVQAKLPNLIEEASKTRQTHNSLKDAVQTLRAQVSELQKLVTQVTTKLREAGFSLETTERDLLTVIADETRQQSQFSALRDAASNLELALDAATTAAALTSLQQNVRNKERAVTDATKRRDIHSPWLTAFTRISRLLSHQQNTAIENFTKEYGPRTAVIQRRLRSVYGFDDVQIQSSDSSILVRVHRNGMELRPIDYFSQSQQQTLLLGIFLTTCISQSWSGFAPIFMDDPVTHFDDLNTYSFLDLIVGLLESDSSNRQFVISTCDEKLLQLARQKFRHFGKDAVYYRFDAIGNAGPVVREIITP